MFARRGLALIGSALLICSCSSSQSETQTDSSTQTDGTTKTDSSPDALVDGSPPTDAVSEGSKPDSSTDSTNPADSVPADADLANDSPTCTPTGDEVCDGSDNDCNGQVDDGIADLSCGVGACARTVAACAAGVPQTCEPGQPTDELCGDGIDNDCNGQVDDCVINKPKVLIIVDTSGSMLQDSGNIFQNGDGSELCNQDGQDSRIYKIKEAISSALANVGDEVELALATFPMLVDSSRSPYCPMGQRNACTTDGDCLRPADTCQPHGFPPENKCLSPCETQPACAGHYYTSSATASENDSVRFGCKISTHDPAAQTVGTCGDATDPCNPWYANLKQEVLKVPFGAPVADLLLYVDHVEDDPLANNPELRVGNGWYTAIGKSLFYAYGYFHKEVALAAADIQKPCERLLIALLSDGAESCNASPTDPFHPAIWATSLYSELGVETHAVAVDSPSNATLQQITQGGNGTLTSVSSSSSSAIAQALSAIIAKATPPQEVCSDSIDNDCDGLVDETPDCLP